MMTENTRIGSEMGVSKNLISFFSGAGRFLWTAVRFVAYAVLRTLQPAVSMLFFLMRVVGFLTLVMSTATFYALSQNPDTVLRHFSPWSELFLGVGLITAGWVGVYVYGFLLYLVGWEE